MHQLMYCRFVYHSTIKCCPPWPAVPAMRRAEQKEATHVSPCGAPARSGPALPARAKWSQTVLQHLSFVSIEFTLRISTRSAQSPPAERVLCNHPEKKLQKSRSFSLRTDPSIPPAALKPPPERNPRRETRPSCPPIPPNRPSPSPGANPPTPL